MAVASDSAQWLIKEILSSLRHAEEVLSVVGILYIGKVTLTAVWDIASALRVHVWSKVVNRNLKEEYGKWAVVTGATDGIGKGYVAALAKHGMNIVLISRTQEKLERVAQDIRNQFGVETEIVRADFATGRPIYDDISKHLASKEIGILVNNVGVLGSNPCFFKDLPEDDIWALVNVNVASVPAMTKIVLPGMLARKKGAIINVSSVGGLVPLPLFQVYSATKAFVTRYSQALEFEYRSSGITIQAIMPGAVYTNMTRFDETLHREGFFIPSPSKFSAHALSTLGYARCTTGYWTHGIQAWFMETLPWCVTMNGVMTTYISRRKK